MKTKNFVVTTSLIAASVLTMHSTFYSSVLPDPNNCNLMQDYSYFDNYENEMISNYSNNMFEYDTSKYKTINSKLKIDIRIDFMTKLDDLMLNFDDNEDEIISFLKIYKKYSKFPVLIKYYFDNTTQINCKNCLNLILSSDINIFESWYKNLLIHFINSSNSVMKFVASNIYQLYKDTFDKI